MKLSIHKWLGYRSGGGVYMQVSIARGLGGGGGEGCECEGLKSKIPYLISNAIT